MATPPRERQVTVSHVPARPEPPALSFPEPERWCAPTAPLGLQVPDAKLSANGSQAVLFFISKLHSSTSYLSFQSSH